MNKKIKRNIDWATLPLVALKGLTLGVLGLATVGWVIAGLSFFIIVFGR